MARKKKGGNKDSGTNIAQLDVNNQKNFVVEEEEKVEESVVAETIKVEQKNDYEVKDTENYDENPNFKHN